MRHTKNEESVIPGTTRYAASKGDIAVMAEAAFMIISCTEVIPCNSIL